ncbi:MAG TPA: GNAT family N-acetyltransferase [Thermomicrobiales bacterium]|jgi:ribosomal protein S18 acetylase RimI-like enzyme
MSAQASPYAEILSTPLCEPLAWDTNFWQIPIARIHDQTLTVASTLAIDRWAAHYRVRCLYFLSQLSDYATRQVAEARDFQAMDIRTTMLLSPVPELLGNNGQYGRALLIRPVRCGDIPLLRRITHDCFQDTRFYADQNFPREGCRSLYETWITRSCSGYADAVLVAEIANTVLGFITCHLTPETANGAIGLVGVSAQARKQGIGHALVQQALEWFASRDVREISVVTQGRNIAARYLYQRGGFRVSAEQIWFHKWYTHQGGQG